MTEKKSYKREMALLMVAFLGYTVWGGDIEMVKVIIWPVFAFAMGAFGLDSYAKQIKQGDSSYITDGKPRGL